MVDYDVRGQAGEEVIEFRQFLRFEIDNDVSA
jgi:hypothetical protein